MLRVVLDTSVLVSTLLVPNGVPAQVLLTWRAHRFALFASPAIISELRRIAGQPRIRKRYGVTDQQTDDLIQLLHDYGTIVEGAADVSDAPLRDPGDLIILAAVVDADAQVLVASDQDLLVLGRYRTTDIVTPRQFLDVYLPSAPDAEA